MDIIIRPEIPSDIESIQQVTHEAFAGKSYSAGTEPQIVAGLRNAGALFLSLVAIEDDAVVGHAAFSRVAINNEDIGWFGLGPISVAPAWQKKGVGSRLIQEGLSLLKESGAKGCVVEGSPAYYQRFGFHSHPALTYHGAPAPEYFMILSFDGNIPAGKVEYHEAFYV